MWVIYFLLFLLLSAKIDAEHIKDNDFIEDHTSRGLLRILVIIILWANFLNLAIMILLWIGLFSPTLNVMLNKDIYYLGTTAKWDKFWNRYPKLYRYFIDGCFIAALLLTIIYYLWLDL